MSETVDVTEPIKCRCGKPYDYALGMPAALWFPTSSVHEFTQSLVIMTRNECCGATSHTEPVATVSAYLRNVKGNAQLMCNLMNRYLLSGRPQPEWLTEAWPAWERDFHHPKFRSRVGA